MKEELLALPRDRSLELEFTPMGLHTRPEKLREELERRLADAGGAERIVLAFGLCGGALAGLKAPGVPVFVPRMHDCIPLFLGSADRFDRVRADEPGTLFLTGGWMEGERTYLADYHQAIDKYGEERGRRIMATLFASYRRVLLIRTGHPREGERRREARDLARLLGLAYEECDGEPGWLQELVRGPWDAERFLRIPPDGEIRQEDYLT
jgi:hypothetical protein